MWAILGASQAVYRGLNYSFFSAIKHCAPQGSILRPIVSLIHIDIVKTSKNFKYAICANDTNMLLDHGNVHDLYINVNTELKQLTNG